MDPKFRFYEIVRILADPPRIKQSLANKEGIVLGMSDDSEPGERYYGVHINEYQIGFAIPEHLLESTGRLGNRDDAIGRPLRRHRPDR